MNLPKTVSSLIQAQNNFDSAAYASCFSQTATVADEGNTYNGIAEIQNWIEKANQQYQATMQPVEYDDEQQILKAQISGNFPGSPAVLTYKFEFSNELIKSLKII